MLSDTNTDTKAAIANASLGSSCETNERDYGADWQAFTAQDIPTKGTAIQPLEEFLVAHPPSLCRNLLDLGCGSGALTYELALKGYIVVGVDINQSAIEEAKKNYQKEGLQFVTRQCAEEGGLDLPTQFHLVVCQLVISVVGGIQERRQLLVNAFNALLPGGCLYVSASGISVTINDQYAKLYAQDRPSTGEDFTYYSRDSNGKVLYETHHFSASELESLLQETGFEDIVIETIKEASSRRPDQAAYFHYVTARKKS